MEISGPDTTSTAENRSGVVLRTVVSAALFGTLGALFGRWLGVRGNAQGSEMARPMMTWGMGGFWALVAAYASLKAEPVAKETTNAAENAMTPQAAKREDVMLPVNPVATVQKESAQAFGKVEETSAIQAMQK